MIRFVADVGNTRVKWGRLAADGTLEITGALAFDDPGAWSITPDAWGSPGVASSWAIASVHPAGLDRLVDLIRRAGEPTVRVFRSAAEVPVRHALATPRTTGADRALAVLAALARHPEGGPGQVVSCGTAVTVERIDDDGTWQGGAILPGLGPMADALHRSTAQLPRVAVVEAPPAPWGNATDPAIAAGVYWGVVGAVRELLSRQAEGLDRPPWRLWAGGDARILAGPIEGASAVIVPDLVLECLARLAATEWGPARIDPGGT